MKHFVIQDKDSDSDDVLDHDSAGSVYSVRVFDGKKISCFI